MAGDSRLSARFGAETSDFKQGITAINRELKLIESEFRATASTMSDWANDADGLKARMGALTKEINLQKEKTEALRQRAEQLAKAHGENSIEAKNAQIEFNKEAEKLGKLQTELGQTERGLKGMQNTSTGVRGAFKNLGTQFDNLKQQVPAVGTAFTMLTNPISLAVAGLAAFTKISKDSVTELVAYNKQVRETSQLTGVSAEETSRLIQVADDWGLEMGKATAAMELMNKKGVTPSIDNLAKIADEYANATDKTLFIEEATKKYGKSFADLVPILAKGGDALREQAASIEDSLIATKASMDASREYEKVMDDLGDTITGLKYDLANGLIPTLVDLLKIIDKTTSHVSSESSAWKILKKLHEANLINNSQLVKGYFELSSGVKEMDDITTQYADELALLKFQEEDHILDMREETKEQHLLNQATDEAAPYASTYYDQLRKVVEATSEAKEPTVTLTEKLPALTTAIQNAGSAFDEADRTARLFEEGLGLVSDSMVDQERIRLVLELGTKKLSAAEIEAKLDALDRLSALENLNKALQTGAIDHYQWLAALADGKVTQEEVNQLLGTTEEDLSAIEKHVIGLDGYTAQVGVNVTVTGDVDSPFYNPPAQQEGDVPWRGQHGLDRVVPSGYPNDTFPILAESGERVIIIPPGKQFGSALSNMQQLFSQSTAGLNRAGGMAGGGVSNQSVSNSWNYTIQAANPLQTSSDLVRQVRLLELMH